jgi:hypothetical protein
LRSSPTAAGRQPGGRSDPLMASGREIPAGSLPAGKVAQIQLPPPSLVTVATNQGGALLTETAPNARIGGVVRLPAFYGPTAERRNGRAARALGLNVLINLVTSRHYAISLVAGRLISPVLSTCSFVAKYSLPRTHAKPLRPFRRTELCVTLLHLVNNNRAAMSDALLH